ncbi:MAG: GNAT family N-acetyltransferase [Candidatus Kapabacteria bacterium]|nr:GNAT family N-acetyltransferase [Candidatus Kapabacteria bacterium]MCS7169256.1 GNAT family N-acetyltransferase [Candidatus Kapabacteria bacterium]MDW7997615.1 GNAT family N-acetyltransferase [Bacteroidota bacterium]MDW8225252.1 GNAT family N-acetyltransferase [Bacteroidota bacterium]
MAQRLALSGIKARVRRLQRWLRQIRQWVYMQEDFLWLQIQLPNIPEGEMLSTAVRVYAFEERWAFLSILPQELVVRLARLWEVLPQSWVFAHAAEGTPVAYYCFVTTGTMWIEEFGLQRVFAPYEAYVHTCYALPGYRGRRLHSRTLQAVCAWLSQRGFRRAFAVVSTKNTPSLRGFQRAGFEIVGYAVHRRFLGRLQRPQPVWRHRGDNGQSP